MIVKGGEHKEAAPSLLVEGILLVEGKLRDLMSAEM